MMSDSENPQPRRSRSQRRGGVFRRLWRWWQETWIAGIFRRLRDRFEDWWYPPPDPSHGGYGYYHSSRQNRLKWLWRRIRRTGRRSFIGSAFRGLKNSIAYGWYRIWYAAPEAGAPQRSRLARAWSRGWRWLQSSWLAARWHAGSNRFYDWWYPPLDESLSHRQLSRPMRLLRRINRRFRRSWLGDKLGWLLDELDSILFQIRLRVAHIFLWRRIRLWLWRWQTGVLLLCLVAAAVAWFQYGLPRYRQYHEQQYTLEAQEFLAKRDFPRAMLRARQVLALNQTNAAGIRIYADLAEMAGSPYALFWRQKLAALIPDTTNRLALAKTSLRAEGFPFPSATKALNELEPAAKQTSTYHLVAGALAIKLNNLPVAEQHYLAARQLNPEDPVNRMSLAVIQLQSANPKLIADSRTTLELLQGDKQVGLVATRSLIAESIGRRELARAEALSWQILTNAEVSFSDRIVHLAILNSAKSGRFEDYLKEVQKHAEEDVFYVGELAAWMNRFGYAKANLEWTSQLPDRLTKQGMTPITIADSYVMLERWKDVGEYLKKTPWAGMEHVRFGMMTLADAKQNEGKRDPLLWQQAIRMAGNSPAMLNALAGMAASWGWKEETERVLWQAVEKFPGQDWPLFSLQHLYTGQRDTAGLRRVFRTIMERNPKDAFARNNFAMVSLLTGTEVATANEYAAELHAAEPNNTAFASTYAFSLYLKGQTQEALRTLRDLGLDRLDDPSLATYYGVFLSALGDKQTARTYFSKSAKAFLLPEEAALVERAKKAM